MHRNDLLLRGSRLSMKLRYENPLERILREFLEKLLGASRVVVNGLKMTKEIFVIPVRIHYHDYNCKKRTVIVMTYLAY